MHQSCLYLINVPIVSKQRRIITRKKMPGGQKKGTAHNIKGEAVLVFKTVKY